MTTTQDTLCAASRGRPVVVIADKNPVVRAGLQDFLSKDGRYAVEPAVDTGNSFVELCQDRKVCVGVIGWTLPDMTALDLLEVVKRRQLGARLIIYASDDGPVRESLKGQRSNELSSRSGEDHVHNSASLDQLAAQGRGFVSRDPTSDTQYQGFSFEGHPFRSSGRFQIDGVRVTVT